MFEAVYWTCLIDSLPLDKTANITTAYVVHLYEQKQSYLLCYILSFCTSLEKQFSANNPKSIFVAMLRVVLS